MKDNVVIIGGGIAGLEAAYQLLSLGYRPVLVEQSPTLGGHVAGWHRLFPDMADASELVSLMIDRVSGSSVHTGTGVQYVNRLRNGYHVMLTNGESIPASALLIASGFKLFEASRKEEYGYGVYDRVITNSDLEKWFSGIPDGRVPDSPAAVGFVHCVGSRDIKAGNTQCSKVCCMTAVKQAMELKARFPGAEVYCFYMDLRLFGKKYEDFYINAQKDFDVHFIRGRVSEVSENIDGRLVVKAEDTLCGRPVKVALDLLVLMAGMVGNPDVNRVVSDIRLAVDSDGFLKSRDNIGGTVESDMPGVFFAGACTGTKTVPETLAEARSAALAIHRYLSR